MGGWGGEGRGLTCKEEAGEAREAAKVKPMSVHMLPNPSSTIVPQCHCDRFTSPALTGCDGPPVTLTTRTVLTLIPPSQ